MERTRPLPDSLLEVAQREENRKRGKLKIFLGYSAGVGKTYAMLEAIAQQRKNSIDAIVGYVETHGRKETDALLQGLEIIPNRKVIYRGTTIQEMDGDAILRRAPQLAAIDELAHTNAPESRHTKRYQDIQELLAAGINVYTTLNIQHIESLNDVVAKITGIRMRETIPDSILHEADEIEVVDIPISELLQRLKQGKVYLPEQAIRATDNFFNEGNLTALREITLRRAARRVDAQMQNYIQRRAITGPWPSQERLLVCVSSYPSSSELVRAGSLLATELDAPWFAVYVEPSTQSQLSEADRNQITKTLELAQELGGKAVTLTGDQIAQEIIAYALQQNITKIIIGKPLGKKWYNLFNKNFVDEIIRYSGNIDVQVINRTLNHYDKSITAFIRPKSSGFNYFQSFLLVALASLIGQFLRDYFAETNLVMFYLSVVVMSALWLGRGPSIFSALLGVVAFDFLFVPPYYTFSITDTQYLLTFIVLFVVGLILSTLVERTRRQTEIVRLREKRTATYGIMRREARDLRTSRELRRVKLSPIRYPLRKKKSGI